ncbi:MAG: GntR family transcriptional regulator [Actinomycetota bacterium]
MATKDKVRLSFGVRDDIAGRIDSGEMPPGARLPPEPELAAELGVSRATLREALRSLEEDGFVTRTRRTGTFVTHRPRLRANLDINFGVTEGIRAAGMTPGTEALTITQAAATREEGRRLALEPGDAVVAVERVRTADGRPVVFSRDIVPRSLVLGRPQVLQLLSTESIYDVLERELGAPVHHGVASFRPVKADKLVAAKLRVIRGALLLYLQQVDYEDGGRPVLYSHEYHLADAFEFTVARRGPGRRLT